MTMSVLRHKNKLFSCFALVVFLASCLTLSSCGGSSSASDPAPDYNVAVQDASQALTANKISRNLTAITPGNPNLLWENGVPGSRLLVASFASERVCSSYRCPAEGCQPSATCKEGKECPTYGYDTWVTVVPELKNAAGQGATPLRVAQILGLPPTASYACVIEMYVSPRNLFRPSPDPEITDQEAEIGFPEDGLRKFDDTMLVWSDMPCDKSLDAAGQPRCPSCEGASCGFTSYKNWFTNRRAYIYSGNAYPFTGLGYTYDWGNQVAPHVGLSEFVLNGSKPKKQDGSPDYIQVFIKSVTPTVSYFQ